MSTLEPGTFAILQVADISRVGAFLEWGQEKDLFLPFAEQTKQLRPGDTVLIFTYIDNTQRICASMRFERNIDSSFPEDLHEGDPVSLIICSKTDLGFKALINGRYLGLLYTDEVFRALSYAEEVDGFIKRIREDGKIDLQLTDPSQIGHRSADPIADQILERLKSSPDGFLPINDKSPAEVIHEWFGVSRKKFKIAMGGLYKRRLILVETEGIRLV